MACNKCGAPSNGPLCQVHRLEEQFGTSIDGNAGDAHDREEREDDDD